MSAQRWKLAAAIGLFAFATFAIARIWLRPGPVSSRINFIDASTGERFSFARSEVVLVPMKNPRTAQETLVPVDVRPDGTMVLIEHYRPVLELLGDRNRVIDPETLAIKLPR